jgi:molybdopterin synthase sulfur carrier subunit
MPKVTFTANIQRHVPCPDAVVPGSTIRAVLDAVFVGNPRARSYVLDDRGALRKHMAIYLDGEIVHDRVRLATPVADASVIHVFQALSGG